MNPERFVIIWADTVCILAPDGTAEAEDLLRECAASLAGNVELGELDHFRHGRPFFTKASWLYPSLSTCGGWIAAAVGLYPIGVDIEIPQRYEEPFMRSVSTESEWVKIQSSQDPDMAFCRLWTRKEAVLKCAGTGIQSTRQVREALQETPFTTKTWEHQGVVLTLALPDQKQS